MRRCAWQCTDTILTIFASIFCTRKLCRPITLQPSVAIAACRKTYFPQIVLLQRKVKPHLGFQNLGCHCPNLGCHFDTQNWLQKLCNVTLFMIFHGYCYVIFYMCATVPLYSDFFFLLYDYGPPVESPCIFWGQSWAAAALFIPICNCLVCSSIFRYHCLALFA